MVLSRKPAKVLHITDGLFISRRFHGARSYEILELLRKKLEKYHLPMACR